MCGRFLALASGLAAGGFFPGPLEPVSDATSVLISWIVAVVPVLILATLSPAIATLVRRGLAGRFAGAVVLWYIFTSIVAGLIALVTSAAIFRIPITTGDRSVWTEGAAMLESLGEGGASWPLLAILAGVLLGVFSARHDPSYRVLKGIANAIENAGGKLAYVNAPAYPRFRYKLGCALRREARPVALLHHDRLYGCTRPSSGGCFTHLYSCVRSDAVQWDQY